MWLFEGFKGGILKGLILESCGTIWVTVLPFPVSLPWIPVVVFFRRKVGIFIGLCKYLALLLKGLLVFKFWGCGFWRSSLVKCLFGGFENFTHPHLSSILVLFLWVWFSVLGFVCFWLISWLRHSFIDNYVLVHQFF